MGSINTITKNIPSASYASEHAGSFIGDDATGLASALNHAAEDLLMPEQRAFQSLAKRLKGPMLYIGSDTDVIVSRFRSEKKECLVISPEVAFLGDNNGSNVLSKLIGTPRVDLILVSSTMLAAYYDCWDGGGAIASLIDLLSPNGIFSILTFAPEFARSRFETCAFQGRRIQLRDGGEDGDAAIEISDCVSNSVSGKRIPFFVGGKRGQLHLRMLASNLVGIAPVRGDTPGIEVLRYKRRASYPLCHPFGGFDLRPDGQGIGVITSGRGCMVMDSLGKEYLDASGGLWNVHVGLGNQEIIDSIHHQAQTLAYATLFEGRANEPAIVLAESLRAIAPYPLDRVFLTGSGSESAEVALRMSRIYQVLTGRKLQRKIAYLDESYHGTFAESMGASGIVPLREIWDVTGGGVPLPTPNPARCPPGMPYEAFAMQCAKYFEDVAEAGDVAALIVEPVLGSAGVIIPPNAYFAKLMAVCRAHNILLIVDEVATGFGRTGRWFACDHFDLEPDIMLLAKGINSGYLPLGAVLLSAEIADRCSNSGMPVLHGSTYNGHPICCASAIANIRVLRRDRLVERSEKMGKILLDAFMPMRELPCVSDIRGLGLMAAIALRQSDNTPATPAQCKMISDLVQKEGVLLYVSHGSVMVCPSLVITHEQIVRLARTIASVLRSSKIWSAKS